MLTFGGPLDQTSITGRNGTNRQPPGGESSLKLGWGEEQGCAGKRADRFSSNAFASGGRQNCQNVLTDKPSTYVSAPPGGHSSLNLGWDSSSPTRAQSHKGFCTQGAGASPLGGRAASWREDEGGRDDDRSSCLAQSRSTFTTQGAGSTPWGGRVTSFHDDEGGSDRQARPDREWPAGVPFSDASCNFSQHGDRRSDARDFATPLRAAWDERSYEYDNHAQSGSKYSNNTRDCREGRTPDRNSMAGIGHNEPLGAKRQSYLEGVPEGSRAGSEMTGSGFDQRLPRSSSNIFASGTRQNSGNMLTDTPSTRVSAPPGGASVLSLGWDYGPCHSQSEQQPSMSGGYGRRTDRRENGKDDIEGSRPRVWKPSLAPQAPPGGITSDSGSASRLDGRKQFSDMGAGYNRDQQAADALRFFKEEERLGKQAGQNFNSTSNQGARDSHRYYLAAEGKADVVPGRAHRSSDASGQRKTEASYSTSAGSDGDELPSPSECDSMPLGAEWCTFMFPASEHRRGQNRNFITY